jgi:hypothetical protein
VLIADLGTDPGSIPGEIAADIRVVLHQHAVRTAPARLYWPGSDPELDDAERSTFRSPTRPDGPYPPL